MPTRPASGFSFFALPDNRQLPVWLGNHGQVEFGRRNALGFDEDTTEYLRTAGPEYWYPQPDDRFPAKPDWIINKCTDPDTYGEALDWLEDRYDGKVPIFNHPAAVRLTSRDQAAARLEGIEGLIVPKCLRFKFETEADLKRTFRQNGFAYPVLVRPAEFQTGTGLVRIDSDSDWAQLMYSRWYLRDHFMTQYVDTKTEEDAYVKARVLFIGGRPFVRHVKASAEWLVHNRRKIDVAGFPERELDFIEELEATKDFVSICHAVADRLPLDQFGMDIGIDLPQNKFVLFEANPSMSVFFPERTDRPESAMERRARLQYPAARHLAKVIREPKSWRHEAGRNR